MLQELIQTLCDKTGLSQDQAQSGLGLLLQLAQSKMGDDFSKVQAFLPEADQLIADAPKAGGLGGFASGLLGSIGGGKLAGLASMAGAAESAGIGAPQMASLGQEACGYLESQGQGEIAGLIRDIL